RSDCFEPVCAFRRDQGRIGQDRDSEALGLGIRKNLEHVATGEDLASRKTDLETSNLSQLVENSCDLPRGQFPFGLVRRVEAVDAAQVTAVTELDHGLERDAVRRGLLGQARPEALLAQDSYRAGHGTALT